ncbi:HD domain-containing protein [Bacillus sp. EB93]|uniref:HD-GYP domain-containing protein n=1 Tax=Peribacillus frigoritolerans TaxID=450367 RepID=UPI00137A985F|nr:HD domain-containing protein [Peribacillus frigoritolerans]
MEIQQIIGGIDFEREINNDVISSLEVAENIILHHHEKRDRTGYPHRLKGEEIPLEARIVASVDVFDALTSIRPYKDSWSVERALFFINEQKGKHFDPSIVMSYFCYFDERRHRKKGAILFAAQGYSKLRTGRLLDLVVNPWR